MLRLVIDEEYRQRQRRQRSGATPVNDDQDPTTPKSPDSPTTAQAAEPRPVLEKPKRKRRGLPPDPVEKPEDASATEESQHVDGPVQDATTEDASNDDSADESTDIGVDLGVLEALLFGTHHPLTAPRLAELMELPSASPLRKAIKHLNAGYESTGRAFRIEQVAGGYQMLTLPEYGDALKRLHQKEIDSKLTKAAIETLAIIAYKQPILRADVEAIRGVACGETIRSLMEKHLVKIAGRAEEPGRPILYGTTKRFLELFGLNSLKDLPQGEELVPKQ